MAKNNKYNSLKDVVKKQFNNILKDKDTILLFAHNGVGKTSLSVAFKNSQKKHIENNKSNTLYFNSFTEDLFYWDNDLENNERKVLKFNKDSKFFEELKNLSIENSIKEELSRYVDFDFKIDYEKWEIIFSRSIRYYSLESTIKKELEDELNNYMQSQEISHKPACAEASIIRDVTHIKISRGEESLFIWCFFLAIVKLSIEKNNFYNDIEYIYIDDPVSSLDDNNVITLAHNLAEIIQTSNKKVIVSTHHTLFFNVMYNELKGKKTESYLLTHSKEDQKYSLKNTKDTPLFHHIVALKELRKAYDTEKIYHYHFNMLRTILEKTAFFLGYEHFSDVLHHKDKKLHQRMLDVLSHGKYSHYDSTLTLEENKTVFKEILKNYLTKYKFNDQVIKPIPKEDK